MAFKLAELFVAISVEGVTSLNKNVDKARKNVAKLGQSFKALGANISGVGKGLLKFGAVLGAPLILGIRQFAKFGDEMQKMSIRTGIAVKELSGLAFATSQSGASIENLEKGIRGLQRNILDLERGLATAKDNFDDLGISIEQLRGLSTSEQFALIADALAKVEDPGTRAALAMKIFGKSGAELLPLLQNGSKGIKLLTDEAEKLGFAITQEQADKAAVLTDAFDKLARTGQALLFAIGDALSGSVTQLVDDIKSVAFEALEWIKDNKELIITLGKLAAVAIALGAGLVILGIAVTTIGTALSFLAATPIGIVIVAVGLLTVAVLKLTGAWDKLTGAQDRQAASLAKGSKSIGDATKKLGKLKEEADVKPRDTTPFFLRDEVGGEIIITPKIDTKKIKKKLKEEKFEIGATFSGIESLFRNAQKAFSENKEQKENTKKTEENTKALKDNTKAIGRLSNLSGKAGGTQQTFMLPLGS